MINRTFANEINLVVIHCTATPNFKHFTAADIHKMHVARGFQGIGYHYVILITGEYEAGRPEYWPGAHVEGHNKNSIGISLVGTDEFTDKQKLALVNLILYLKEKYGKGIKIVGHRDLSPDKDGDGIVEPNEWVKVCPGFDVSQFLKINGL